jgi:hypothetical protein
MKLDGLPPEVRERYEQQVLSNPATTVRSARDWLAREGFAVSPAAVTRHRRQFLEERERRAHAGAVAAYTEELAAPDGLTPQDLAAGAALRARLDLFKKVRDALRVAHRERRPATAEQLLEFAAALRLHLAEGPEDGDSQRIFVAKPSA